MLTANCVGSRLSLQIRTEVSALKNGVLRNYEGKGFSSGRRSNTFSTLILRVMQTENWKQLPIGYQILASRRDKPTILPDAKAAPDGGFLMEMSSTTG